MVVSVSNRRGDCRSLQFIVALATCRPLLGTPSCCADGPSGLRETPPPPNCCPGPEKCNAPGIFCSGHTCGIWWGGSTLLAASQTKVQKCNILLRDRSFGPQNWRFKLCDAKKPPIDGHADILHREKPPKSGHGDIVHYQKAPHIAAWGHFALPKRPQYMGTGTLCAAKSPPYMQVLVCICSNVR